MAADDALRGDRSTPLDVQPPGERIAQAVEALKSMADSVRLSILWALLSGELSVNAIADVINTPASTVSRHLARLRAARLVATRRDANRVFYSLSDNHVAALVKEVVFHTNHVGDGHRHDRAAESVEA